MTLQNATAPGETARADNFEPSQALELSRAPLALRHLASVIMTAIATVVAVGVESQVTIPNLSLVFVIPVVIAAVTAGLGPSLCAAILGALAYNFFLTEPRYSLAVDDPANIWAIALLFVVGCIASGVASIAKRKADDAALMRRQAALLQHYGREAAGTGQSGSLASITADTLEALFRVPVVVIVMSETGENVVEQRGAIGPLTAVEIEAAELSLANRRLIPARAYPFDASRFDFWPAGQKAAIGLAFDPDERPGTPEILVGIVGSLFALALDRQHSARPRS
jgi:K+-sensing histidine kinase KdpD